MQALLLVLLGTLSLMIVFIGVHYNFNSLGNLNPSTIDYSFFLKPFLLSFGTIFGILFRTLSEVLERQETDHVRLRLLFSKGVKSRNFWLATFISPVIILSMYPSIDSIDNNLLVALISYENGFFFRVIVEKREKKMKGN